VQQPGRGIRQVVHAGNTRQIADSGAAKTLTGDFHRLGRHLHRRQLLRQQGELHALAAGRTIQPERQLRAEAVPAQAHQRRVALAQGTLGQLLDRQFRRCLGEQQQRAIQGVAHRAVLPER